MLDLSPSSDQKQQNPEIPPFLQGGGEAGSIIRQTDWSQTAVGPIESWPQSLKLAISIMLDNKFGMYIAWGKEFIQFYNDGYRPILGSSKHPEAIGRRTEQTFAESWHIIGPLFHKVMEGESVGSEDWLLPLHRHGYLEDCYFTYCYSPIRDEHGKVGGVLVTVMETTARVNSQKELQIARAKAENAESSLQQLFSQAPVGIAALTGPNHVFTLANPRYMELLFGQQRDFVGLTVAQALPEVVEQGFIGLLDQVYLLGKTIEGKEVPLAILQIDGTTRHFFVNFSYEPIRDERGKVTGVLAVVYDVTELVAGREKLQESEIRFRALANSIPQLAWMADEHGHVMWYNQNWYDYTGTTVDQMLRSGARSLLDPKLTEKVAEKWQAHVRSGEAWEDTFPIKSKTGEWRWFLSRAKATRDAHGKIIHWFGTNTDIEEQRKVKEAAEAASATKSAFLANMSHEIRTPLGAILGFGSLLKDRQLSDEERDQFIDTMNRNGESLSRIIDDILDLAKVEAGKLEVEEIEVSVSDLLGEVLEVFRDKAKQKSIQLSLDIGSGVPTQIKSDPTRLRQILTNLIGNAVKFTESGDVSILVHADVEAEKQMRLRIEVRDSGIGLTQEQQERLFQPFAQADNSTSRKFGGTGLGLALSKRLSEALGGSVSLLASEPGRGSTFVLTFTAALTQNPTASAVVIPNNADARESRLDHLAILVADDSPDNLLLVRRILTKKGASVETASDGQQAIVKAMSGSFDLVLMDIQMPVMDGYQALKTLLNLGYAAPIVALTAHAMTEERVRTKEAGFVAHLTKPLLAHELVATVYQVTKGAERS